MNLSRYFNSYEFDSKDGAVMPNKVSENIKILANNLDVLREYIGQPIYINSGYRSLNHNARIGGVRNSYHTLGMASDISVKNYTPKKLARTIKKLIRQGKMKQGGIGLYNGFVHYDIRGYAARWDNSSWFNF